MLKHSPPQSLQDDSKPVRAHVGTIHTDAPRYLSTSLPETAGSVICGKWKLIRSPISERWRYIIS